MNGKTVPIGRNRASSGGQTPIRHSDSSLQHLNEHKLFTCSDLP